jgi:hypothetical protein
LKCRKIFEKAEQILLIKLNLQNYKKREQDLKTDAGKETI